jgi:hypothetical protein
MTKAREQRNAMLVMRLPEAVKDALREAADADSRSLSSMALIIVREGLEARGHLGKPTKQGRKGERR